MNTKRVSVFKDLITNQNILDYLKKEKLENATNVQKQSIPKLLKKGNFIVQGKTGSGKTLAFLIPLFCQLKELESQNFQTNKSNPLSIIVAPTREIALQIFNISKDISHFAKLRVRKLVGGDKGKSMKDVFTSHIDLLVATPDRLLKAVNNNELKLDDLQILIFDEADQLLENSFKKTMLEFSLKVQSKKIQIFLFSATKPINFEDNINEYFPNIKFEIIGKGQENRIGHHVRTRNINATEENKLSLLNSFIKSQNQSNGIIFVGNRFRAQNVYDALIESGHKKSYLIHKEIERDKRLQTMKLFAKTGGVIVATDILARGIDISHLLWVLNFDLPSASEYYLHRTGRVGRAGKHGEIFNFVTSRDGLRQKNINIALISQGRMDLKIPENISNSTSLRTKKKSSLKNKTNAENTEYSKNRYRSPLTGRRSRGLK